MLRWWIQKRSFNTISFTTLFFVEKWFGKKTLQSSLKIKIIEQFDNIYYIGLTWAKWSHMYPKIVKCEGNELINKHGPLEMDSFPYGVFGPWVIEFWVWNIFFFYENFK